jgi:hypothetical protein
MVWIFTLTGRSKSCLMYRVWFCFYGFFTNDGLSRQNTASPYSRKRARKVFSPILDEAEDFRLW